MVQKKTSLSASTYDYSNEIQFGAPSFLQQSINESSFSPRNEAEKKRHELRQALANRLRFDLVQQEEEKEFKQQYDRLASFDRQLKDAETNAKKRKEQEKEAKELTKRQEEALANAIQNSKIT